MRHQSKPSSFVVSMENKPLSICREPMRKRSMLNVHLAENQETESSSMPRTRNATSSTHGSERSVTAKDEFTTSDPTLLRVPTNKAEDVLKQEVSQNVTLRFGKLRNQLIAFPVNHAVWSIFMNSCMWAVLQFNRDGGEFRHVLKNPVVCKVMTIIDNTVQAQMMNLIFRDSGIRMHFVHEWLDGRWRTKIFH